MALKYNNIEVTPKEFAQIILIEKIRDINIVEIAKERNKKITDLQAKMLTEQYDWLISRINKLLKANENIFKVRMIDSVIYDPDFKEIIK